MVGRSAIGATPKQAACTYSRRLVVVCFCPAPYTLIHLFASFPVFPFFLYSRSVILYNHTRFSYILILIMRTDLYTVLSLASLSFVQAQWPVDTQAATVRELEHLFLDGASHNLKSMITPWPWPSDSCRMDSNRLSRFCDWEHLYISRRS